MEVKKRRGGGAGCRVQGAAQEIEEMWEGQRGASCAVQCCVSTVLHCSGVAHSRVHPVSNAGTRIGTDADADAGVSCTQGGEPWAAAV